ncbi:PAS domain-containing protein [Limisalsivibrio acetivorans]|uniref:PAS domain-containing protein n=1 Tax=Limisalsivibrio acetivorans TaxID=1304888 RepID=UPI0003B4CE81|nr:PAS domain-containing protein [Limisalsivibrio acetivorans]
MEDRWNEFAGFLEKFSGLFWELELKRSRITFLNDTELEVLGVDTGRFLKDPILREKLIHEDDKAKFERFLSCMKENRDASCTFRVSSGSDEWRWLRIVGSPAVSNGGYYYGVLLDVHDSIEEAVNAEKKNELDSFSIEMFDFPVLLADFKTKKILSANSAARMVFKTEHEEVTKLEMEDILSIQSFHNINDILESVSSKGSWNGQVYYKRKPDEVFTAKSKFRLIYCNGRWIIRLSIIDIQDFLKDGALDQKVEESELARYSEELAQRIKSLDDPDEFLDVMLNNQPDGVGYEAIIFSDVYSKKNKVVVYHAGDIFSTLKQGESFAYIGTIAQDMNHFRLEHLIVDDTLDSIKSIDWALFIPKGVRSYFAKAFYIRGVVRSVMILCSSRPNAYHSDNLPFYKALYKPFEVGTKCWRKSKR